MFLIFCQEIMALEGANLTIQQLRWPLFNRLLSNQYLIFIKPHIAAKIAHFLTHFPQSNPQKPTIPKALQSVIHFLLPFSTAFLFHFMAGP